MFTGIVLESAELVGLQLDEKKQQARFSLAVKAPQFASVKVGDSIACDGVCLTVVSIEERTAPRAKIFSFDVSPETLHRTAWAQTLKLGCRIHVEPALAMGERFGGHWVSGHVDGLGQVKASHDENEFRTLVIEVCDNNRHQIAPYLIPKGSITVNGVSLTVNRMIENQSATQFELMLIPHTLTLTTLGALKAGDFVHLEADILGKYIHRFSSYQALIEGSLT